MTQSLEQAKRIIGERVELFARNIDQYRSADYKEAQLRREFLDPFFEALGWDVTNKQGWSEQYKEVVNEDALKIAGATKAPDYSFRIGGVRKFFAEAKKPAVTIKTEASAAYQLRRYAWSAQLPLSILSDFEELAVYDCRARPSDKDKPSVGRVNFFTFDQYLDRLPEIYDVFSKEAVLRGSFDRYVQETKGKRGTTPVDAEFLKEIEGWRATLAKNIALLNPRLTLDELNDAVQRTIDRIIFLRMAEDRGAEEYARLSNLSKRANIYMGLLELCHQADTKYNSGLFDFTMDALTPRLKIDDDKLRDILADLYYPQSPYEFSVLAADTLGNVYEQFLGKVIRLTPSHQAKIEEKPEVKKAGGVYYTPTYIVDYIVKQTVDKMIEGKSPDEIARLRILDPACGSGSFLLGAYQLLLDHHLNWYVNHRDDRQTRERIYESATGWRLTTAEKKRILLNNIFGVDIDRQAVEVTKLSLLLKVLEGENQETLGKQLALFKERALPNLDANIRCGNSLIGMDYFAGQLMPDKDEYRRVNPFDWAREFPEVFDYRAAESAEEKQGFDAVIGNPPYIFTRNQGISESQKKYFYSHYRHQSMQLNTFGIFVERCYSLLRKSGVLGFITPNNWLTIDTFAPFRKFILESAGNVKVVNILDRVFQAANVDTAIIFFEKSAPTHLTISEFSQGSETFSRQVQPSSIKPPSFILQISSLKDEKTQEILDRVHAKSRPLSEFCTVSTGLKAYQIGKGKPRQTKCEKENRVFHTTSKRNKTYEKYLAGVDVQRYYLGWSGEYLSYGDWLAEPRKSVPFKGERLLVRQIPSKPPYLVHAAYTDEAFYNDINSMVVFAPRENISLKYLLGLINSRLLSLWFQRAFDKLQRKIFPQFKVNELASFPICPINFADPQDKSRHDRVVALVTRMLELHKQARAAQTAADREMWQRQIDATDAAIDALVYELYGLSEEERRVVER